MNNIHTYCFLKIYLLWEKDKKAFLFLQHPQLHLFGCTISQLVFCCLPSRILAWGICSVWFFLAPSRKTTAAFSLDSQQVQGIPTATPSHAEQVSKHPLKLLKPLQHLNPLLHHWPICSETSFWIIIKYIILQRHFEETAINHGALHLFYPIMCGND